VEVEVEVEGFRARAHLHDGIGTQQTSARRPKGHFSAKSASINIGAGKKTLRKHRHRFRPGQYTRVWCGGKRCYGLFRH